MVKVSYHPEPGSPDETTQFGYDFADGKPTDVKAGDRALAKFSGNRFFKIHGETSAPEKTADGLKAVHNGGGRFVIKKGNDIVKDGLNKADSDAFNALTDDEKASYVAD